MKVWFVDSFAIFEMLHNWNSTSVNEDIFIKNLQGSTFAFAQLFLQIEDSHIRYEGF
jgi:hypothetical protein